jgi:cell division protease FtsH
VPLPDISGRLDILNVHARNKPLDESVDLSMAARSTPGFSGAQLANALNEAAIQAVMQKREKIGMDNVSYAIERELLGGPERKSMAMTANEKKLTAWHEAGHTIIGLFVEGNDPFHKVTIVPRGQALGLTINLPEQDQLSISRRQMEARMVLLYGGREAERILAGPENITTGASNDILRATNLAWQMAAKYGFDDELGPVNYSADSPRKGYLGEEFRQRDMAEQTKRELDMAVRSMVKAAEEKARKVLETHPDALRNVAEALEQRETLNREEVLQLAGFSEGNNLRIS